jgi:hypothetical protein
MGTEREQLMSLCDRVNAAYMQAKLPPRAGKAVLPTLDVVITLGVDIDGRRGHQFNSNQQLAIIAA